MKVGGSIGGKMAWIRLGEVLASILNNDGRSSDFTLLDSAREDEEVQEGRNIWKVILLARIFFRAF